MTHLEQFEWTARASLGALPAARFIDTLDQQSVRWYAVYTRSRHEKRVSETFAAKSIEHLLPVYESMRRWNDRKAIVRQPLFPGYIFVRICPAERMKVVSVPGVVDLVGKQGCPTPIADHEITSLQTCLTAQKKMEPHPYLVTGRQVRIKSGLLAETEGILVRKRGQFRLVICVNLINRSVAVEVDAEDVEPIANPARHYHS